MDIGVPEFAVGDTVVVCRPDQLREAAVVASCLPADRLTPVVAIEPPPTSREEHIKAYELHHLAQQRTQGRIGTPLGMAEVLGSDGRSVREMLAAIETSGRLAAKLTAYRSWVKHNEMVSRIVSRLGIERVVLLHDFTPEDLVTVDPALDERYNRYLAANGQQAAQPITQMFAEVPTRLRLSGLRLGELTDAAWRLLRDADGLPERVIEVPADGPARWPAALFTALRSGAVLRAVDHPAPPLDELFAAVNPDGPEAVLVEDTGDASTLLGALYAHHRGARLVVTPPPDLSPVRAAVAARQQRVGAAARGENGGDGEGGSDGARGSGVLGKLRGRFFDGGRHQFAELEAAVTGQVPAAAIAEVGERRLTAFTTGLPYGFVRTATADWSHKPIGHVAADAALIILNELHAQGAGRPEGAFSLVFDPGFFVVSETEDVLRAVGTHFTHPILLSGEDASMRALQALPRRLPVELIFFNTHGTDDGIMLGDVPLPSHLLPQLFELDHRPIVFNNSCQSWTGIGREFIRIGARGYIGTLWDIPSRRAADFARVVTDRLTVEEAPAADAIVNTGLQAIERSYLYVGTVNGRLSQWPDRISGGEAVLRHGGLLAAAALQVDGEVARTLHREITTLRRAVAGTEFARHLAFADLLLDELRLVGARGPGPDADRQAVEELVPLLDETLHRLDLPPVSADQRWAARFQLTGDLHAQHGEWGAALADYDRSLGYGEACPNRAHLLLRKAQLLMRGGDQEQALRTVAAARDLCTEQGDEPTLMRALGVLGQLSKRFGRHEEARALAEQGYALAVKLENRREQGTFLLDLSTLQQLTGDLGAATASAAAALETLRACRNEEGELVALGRLGGCYREQGELRAAGDCARTGLEQARRLGNRVEEAAFHSDIAQLLTLEGRHAEALEHHVAAASGLVELGAFGLGAPMVGFLVDCALRVGAAEELWSAAVWGVRICTAVEQHQWSAVVPKVVAALKEAFVISPATTMASRLPELVELTSAGRPNGRPDGRPEQLRLLDSVLMLLWHWLMGEQPTETADLAGWLDSQTQGVFGLAEFVALSHAERVRTR
ncbi:tetratricopeptide repeat protein [Kitasatospora sp. NPDC008050]|uniref:tetratricopeptide repeat protein n=1 Tax=Kitasatospora sp. NPDC008050 TaxID=3364021 RepID=UPI0036E28A35